MHKAKVHTITSALMHVLHLYNNDALYFAFFLEVLEWLINLNLLTNTNTYKICLFICLRHMRVEISNKLKLGKIEMKSRKRSEPQNEE